MTFEAKVELLPKGVFRRGPSLYWIVIDPITKRQKWHRLGRTWGEAQPHYRRLVAQTRTPAYVARTLYSESEGPVPAECLKGLLRNAKKNAATKAVTFSLTIDDLRALAERSSGRCELSGIKFEYGVAHEMRGRTGRRRRLWAPSLDRIEPTAGYVAGNVRLLCLAVNAARQEFGDEVLFKLALAISNIQFKASRIAA